MAPTDLVLLDWNVRGFNQPIRRDVVKEMTHSTRATVVCLPETKLQVIDDAIVMETLSVEFIGNNYLLPTRGSHGGILIAVSDWLFTLLSSRVTRNTITVTVQMLDSGEEWMLTGIYGLQ